MRKRLDEDHSDLSKVLESLIASDVEITFREIARLHPTLNNASDFSRSTERLKVIDAAKRRQSDARNVAAGPRGAKSSSLVATLALKEERIGELERQVKSLVASHAACVRAVLVHGGMPALRRFWKDYKSIGDDLATLEAIPPSADVIPLKPKAK